MLIFLKSTFGHSSTHWFCCLAQRTFDPPVAQKKQICVILYTENGKLYKINLTCGIPFNFSIIFFLRKIMETLLAASGTVYKKFAVTAWEDEKKGRETDTALKQMGLVLGLRSDQKHKIGCIPFMVYPQEICFSWKKLLSSQQKKPNVKIFKRGTTYLVSLVEMAQPGTKTDFQKKKKKSLFVWIYTKK